MDNLKIIFELSTPMVTTGYPIHLDALLAYAATQRELPYLENHNQEELDLIYSELPIEKYEKDGDWVFKASALMPEGSAYHSSQFYTRRTDEMDLAVKASKGIIQVGKMKHGEDLKPHAMKLDMVRGSQRNLLGYYSTTDVDKVVAYCVGDKDLIEEILIDYGFISHLGKRRRTGHGNIKSINIEVDESTEKMWMHRMKPWKLLDNDVAIKAVTKAPYWDKSKTCQAYCPSSLA